MNQIDRIDQTNQIDQITRQTRLVPDMRTIGFPEGWQRFSAVC
jgi:hypothetical protein